MEKTTFWQLMTWCHLAPGHQLKKCVHELNDKTMFFLSTLNFCHKAHRFLIKWQQYSSDQKTTPRDHRSPHITSSDVQYNNVHHLYERISHDLMLNTTTYNTCIIPMSFLITTIPRGWWHIGCCHTQSNKIKTQSRNLAMLNTTICAD